MDLNRINIKPFQECEITVDSLALETLEASLKLDQGKLNVKDLRDLAEKFKIKFGYDIKVNENHMRMNIYKMLAVICYVYAKDKGGTINIDYIDIDADINI